MDRETLINIQYKVFRYILYSFTEVDILCFGCMKLKKILYKKVKTPSCYFEKILIPGYLLHQKKWLPHCILHRPHYTVNFSSPLNIDGRSK